MISESDQKYLGECPNCGHKDTMRLTAKTTITQSLTLQAPAENQIEMAYELKPALWNYRKHCSACQLTTKSYPSKIEAVNAWDDGDIYKMSDGMKPLLAPDNESAERVQDKKRSARRMDPRVLYATFRQTKLEAPRQTPLISNLLAGGFDWDSLSNNERAFFEEFARRLEKCAAFDEREKVE